MISIKNLYSRDKTVEEIRRLSKTYSNDMIYFKDYSVIRFFNYLKSLKYHRDVYPVEILRRPKLILSLKEGDCKKKTILALSYAKLKNIPNRILTISTRKDSVIHHVFPQFFIKNQWINFDATYPHYRIADKKYITNLIIYPGV